MNVEVYDASHDHNDNEKEALVDTDACGSTIRSQQASLVIDYDIGSGNSGVNPMLSPMTIESHTEIDPSSCVQVAVRVRPLLALEGDDECCVQVLRHNTSYHGSKAPTITNSIQIGGSSGPQYTFDQVFDMETTQIQIYESRVAPLIGSCLDGYNATILAYGQTGSGVSFLLLCRLDQPLLQNDLTLRCFVLYYRKHTQSWGRTQRRQFPTKTLTLALYHER